MSPTLPASSEEGLQFSVQIKRQERPQDDKRQRHKCNDQVGASGRFLNKVPSGRKPIQDPYKRNKHDKQKRKRGEEGSDHMNSIL
jgi:hypothetical protein